MCASLFKTQEFPARRLNFILPLLFNVLPKNPVLLVMFDAVHYSQHVLAKTAN